LGIETEAKYMIICDVDKLSQLLISQGFKHVDTCVETDTYFNHPCRDFRSSDEAIRIRKRRCGDRIEYRLTYKGPRVQRGDAKIREELEIPLIDIVVMRNIFERLGFRDIASFSKERLIYSDGSNIVSIDNLFKVGYFLEIEGDEATINRLRNVLKECLVPISKTYLEICLEKSRCTSIDH